jgi:glycosyltransferase involved in cell wall biosynthesis
MRVVIVSNSGFDHMLAGWAAGAVEHGHEVILAGIGDKDHRWREPDEGFDRALIDSELYDHQLAELAEGANLINCHTRASLAGLNIPVAHSLFRHSTASALHTYLDLTCSLEESTRRFDEEVTLVAKANRLASPSRYALDYDAPIFGRPGDVVYPFVEDYIAELPRSEALLDKPMWMGRPVTRKGLGWLCEHHEEWSFEFLWSGNLGSFDVDPRDRPMVERAERYVRAYADVRELSEMLPVYAQTKVVLCPYLDEPFGMVIPEALAAGARVVAFSSGGVPEMGDLPGLTLVAPLDVQAFDDAVRAAMSSPPLSSEERHVVTERFSRESSVAGFVAHLEASVGEWQGH